MSEQRHAFICKICLSEHPTDPVVSLCGHIFCFPCINEWLSRGATSCPVCKSGINSQNDLISIYPDSGGGESSSATSTSTTSNQQSQAQGNGEDESTAPPPSSSTTTSSSTSSSIPPRRPEQRRSTPAPSSYSPDNGLFGGGAAFGFSFFPFPMFVFSSGTFPFNNMQAMRGEPPRPMTPQESRNVFLARLFLITALAVFASLIFGSMPPSDEYDNEAPPYGSDL